MKTDEQREAIRARLNQGPLWKIIGSLYPTEHISVEVAELNCIKDDISALLDDNDNLRNEGGDG